LIYPGKPVLLVAGGVALLLVVRRRWVRLTA
jgi:hypothetical protein